MHSASRPEVRFQDVFRGKASAEAEERATVHLEDVEQVSKTPGWEWAWLQSYAK